MRYAKQTTIVTEEKPEAVEEKKVLIRANQIVWYIFDLIAFLLAFRMVLRALGANTAAGFTSFIYGITAPFVAPFRGILPVLSEGRFVIEWSTLIAIFVYLMLALAINYILDIMYPISDRDVK
jgi:uncharacterized protein YggT (Ycf19 family)